MIVGFCNGCFDLLHDGHKFFLFECARRCEYLIVAVNTDESVRTLKGNERPIWPLQSRISAIRSYLRHQEHAVIPFDGNESKLLESIRPQVYFRGGDHRASPDPIYGAEVVRINRVPGISTTEILNAQASRSHLP